MWEPHNFNADFKVVINVHLLVNELCEKKDYFPPKPPKHRLQRGVIENTSFHLFEKF
jgi:hypothetical protein